MDSAVALGERKVNIIPLFVNSFFFLIAKTIDKGEHGNK
jgi:hypothetical protein